MVTTFPEYVIERVTERPPTALGVVAGSTPVVAFGDMFKATVATLGLNSSKGEFLNRDGSWLSEGERRLATLKSLSATEGVPLTQTQASQVVEECVTYFQADHNPYWLWFKPLNVLLEDAETQTSYSAGTACHLDLVQWATDPVWSGLGRSIQEQLIRQDKNFLVSQLRNGHIRTVLLNGKAVVDQAPRLGVSWSEQRKVTLAGKGCVISVGDAAGVRFIGWSTNLQSSFGVSNEFKSELARLIARELHA
ncbi:MAG: hypothetical protein LBM94_03825 [Propionibacteriaceae bacterium]|jgi:hypothetical protein|nr:hypothetical protein [Propionibacteriaceae bacterium]